VRLAAG